MKASKEPGSSGELELRIHGKPVMIVCKTSVVLQDQDYGILLVRPDAEPRFLFLATKLGVDDGVVHFMEASDEQLNASAQVGNAGAFFCAGMARSLASAAGLAWSNPESLKPVFEALKDNPIYLLLAGVSVKEKPEGVEIIFYPEKKDMN